MTRFSEGEIFGEMALIDKNLRSGTAIASSDSILIKIPTDYFERNIGASDDLTHTLLKVLLTRYREMRGRFDAVVKNVSLNEVTLDYDDKSNKTRVETQSTSCRIQQEINLSTALKDNQFELFYQPIISIENNQVIGCESLIRWRHPEKGIISPLDFISLAEDTGLINPLGKWIIEEACRARNRFFLFRDFVPSFLYKALTIKRLLNSIFY